ncbi:hypothetical protein VPHD518_0077 [Vibrio phage D518]
MIGLGILGAALVYCAAKYDSYLCGWGAFFCLLHLLEKLG